MSPSLLDSVLESLDLSRAEPGTGLLEALFARFNARVPFETASKIERDAAVADSAQKPRRPELFWTEHLELKTGGTCFARVAAFESLLAGLGFAVRKILGRVQRDFDHAALIVGAGERPWIADVGFPLPALTAAAPGEVATALGAMTVESSPRGWRVDLGGVPEGPRSLELFAAEVPGAEFDRKWRETFRPESKFLTEVGLRISRENRSVSFARGSVRVDDLHSRLTVPVLEDRAGRCSELFGVDRDLLRSAFARVGDPEPEQPNASLLAYLESPADPERAFAAIAGAANYRRLLEGVAEAVSEEGLPGGFALRLRAPGGDSEAGLLEDRVSIDPSELRIRIDRRAPSGASTQTFFQAAERGGRSYLIRGLTLQGAREELLRNDALRGRLAGSLAAELLAWARLLGRDPGRI